MMSYELSEWPVLLDHDLFVGDLKDLSLLNAYDCRVREGRKDKALPAACRRDMNRCLTPLSHDA